MAHKSIPFRIDHRHTKIPVTMTPHMGQRRKGVQWTNPEKLRQELEFTSVAEMKDYLTDPKGRFWPFFYAYAKDFVYKVQEQATAKGED